MRGRGCLGLTQPVNATVAVMTNVLVTGMSGTGKSSALAKLAQGGYAVLDTDEPGWLEWVDSSEELFGGEWMLVEDRMSELLRSDVEHTLFVAGCARNQGKFYRQFHAVVLLSAPADVILHRIERRNANPYGKTPAERDMILHDVATVEPLLRASCTHELDASRPLDQVVADLIAISNTL